MLALILDTNEDRRDHCLIAMMQAGLTATGSGRIQVIETALLNHPTNLLVIDKYSAQDALGDLIGMAEERNPYLVTLLYSDTPLADLDALSGHFPSLHYQLGMHISPDTLTTLAIAALEALESRVPSPREHLHTLANTTDLAPHEIKEICDVAPSMAGYILSRSRDLLFNKAIGPH